MGEGGEGRGEATASPLSRRASNARWAQIGGLPGRRTRCAGNPSVLGCDGTGQGSPRGRSSAGEEEERGAPCVQGQGRRGRERPPARPPPLRSSCIRAAREERGRRETPLRREEAEERRGRRRGGKQARPSARTSSDRSASKACVAANEPPATSASRSADRVFYPPRGAHEEALTRGPGRGRRVSFRALSLVCVVLRVSRGVRV